MSAIKICNSKVHSAMWPSFELVKYVIPVLFICKFCKDWEKIKQVMLRIKLNMVVFVILTKLELLGNFMPVQVTCNFHKEQVKLTGYAPDKVKYGFNQHLRASN